MVMCPKQKQNANWSQVEIEILILKGRNLPRTNSTKSETQNIFAKKQQNEHTPVTEFNFRIQGCARFAEILTVFKWTHKKVQAPQNVEFE